MSVRRGHVVGVVVRDALQPADLPDRAQRRAAELAHALGVRIRPGVELVGLLVEQQASILLTSNRDRAEWPELFGEPLLV